MRDGALQQLMDPWMVEILALEAHFLLSVVADGEDEVLQMSSERGRPLANEALEASAEHGFGILAARIGGVCFASSNDVPATKRRGLLVLTVVRDHVSRPEAPRPSKVW